jgi:hypothetical protein
MWTRISPSIRARQPPTCARPATAYEHEFAASYVRPSCQTPVKGGIPAIAHEASLLSSSALLHERAGLGGGRAMRMTGRKASRACG